MEKNNLLMKGKKGLIMGVANEKSIAWGIAEILSKHGAQLAITYQGSIFEKRVKPLADSLGCKILLDCDVKNSSSISKAFDTLKKEWGSIDFLVHSIAFSDRDELKGKYIDTSRENFLNTLEISCYSFTEVCKHAASLMQNGGSVLTLSYIGAERVMPHYNVMGIAKAALEASVKYLAADLGNQSIRVNAISAGPMKTLAASAIGDFRYILKWNEYNAPLKRGVTKKDIGDSAIYLLGDLSKGVTGEVLHVDCGYHIVGMKAIDAPDISTIEED